MLFYGLALVPLLKTLCEKVPDLSSPIYTNDSAFSGKASQVCSAMKLLQQVGPTRGYYPAPTKSIVIPSQSEYTEKTKEVLSEFNFQYMEGSRYLGGFIGSEAALDDWLLPKIDQWVESIKTFGRIAKQFHFCRTLQILSNGMELCPTHNPFYF